MTGSVHRDPGLLRLLDARTPVSVTEVQWARRLRVSAYLGDTYLGDEELPDHLVTSVRCLVRVGDRVVVCTNADGFRHAWPGGRCEPGETHLQTVCREVLEETGWHLDPDSVEVLGFLHLHNLGDPLPPYPHPDVLQVVTTAVARSREADDWTDVEGYELSSCLLPIDEAIETVSPEEPMCIPYLRRVERGHTGPMGRALEDAPFLNFLDPEVQADPEPVFAELRRQSALARTPLGVTVLRREHVHRLLGDQRLVAAIPHLVRIQASQNSALLEMLGATVIAVDGPDHTRLRRLVSRSFTPRPADRHRPVMRELVNDLVDGFADAGRCEFVSAFADHYPVRVICEVLGVPREDHPLFARWGETLTYVLSLELGAHLADIEQAAGELSDYIDLLVEDRRARPRDDLVTSLARASEDGDQLSPLELRAMIGGLLFAGYDTTRNQLGHAMVTFCNHPEQWELLAAEPDRAPQAVDEVMRLWGAVSGIPRIAAEDLDVDGWAVPAGTVVFLSVASANRDEAVYDDASTFDITADRVPHLTFGGGPHYCLGANLARAEMEEALRILPGRLPHLRLDEEPSWRQGTGISGPTELHLSFGAARA